MLVAPVRAQSRSVAKRQSRMFEMISNRFKIKGREGPWPRTDGRYLVSGLGVEEQSLPYRLCSTPSTAQHPQ